MTEEEAKAILTRYNLNQCTEEEQGLLEEWLLEYNETELEISEEQIEAHRSEIYKNLPCFRNSQKLLPAAMSTAVAILIAIGIWVFVDTRKVGEQQQLATNDIMPGGNRATLRLANGQTIQLSDLQTGLVVGENSLRYEDGSAVRGNVTNDAQINTLTIPKGGQYAITLSDGSKVTLNAGSTLSYPSTFSGQEIRRVRLTGEAYFEVAKDKKHPFIVETETQQVKVLGTHFNISAYSEEAVVKTTLLEGSVRVFPLSAGGEMPKGRRGGKSMLLKPNEQSSLSRNNIEIRQVDPGLATAWKNGKTKFEDADLKSVMTMLERWYDIETEYETYPATSRFTGSISRNKNISEVLRLLETTGEVHFKIAGRRVEVTK